MKSSYITYLYNKGYLNRIDFYFAQFIKNLTKNDDPDVALGAALVSNVTGKGHVCLDLTSVSHMFEDPESETRIEAPEFSVWVDKLRKSPAVGMPGEYCPMVLDQKARLYLYRYWDYENQVSQLLRSKAKKNAPPVDHNRLKENLDRVFPSLKEQQPDLQKLAALISVLKQVCVITGGPGTGKTTTIVRILAILLEQSSVPELKIFLAAPTGKAAARLGQAVKDGIGSLNCPEPVKRAIPVQTFTIHRLLKSVQGSPYFRYNANNPLPADVLVVDESSMIDIALMSKLVQALPENAKLILVGDKDQLASVEAGYVFGDICGRHANTGFSNKFGKALKNLISDQADQLVVHEEPQSYLADCIVNLKTNYRFAADSHILKLGRAVNSGDTDAAIELITAGSDHDYEVFSEIYRSPEFYLDLAKIIEHEYRQYFMAADPHEALKLFAKFKILCAVRKGEYGVNKINNLAEQVLSAKGLIRHTPGSGPWYSKRPVLITHNDYNLGLFNGDIGIALNNPETGKLDVCFSGMSGKIRRFPWQTLPEHETAYAMTVHKSQGSEFDRILLILPDSDSPVLTRELIYTGITRAKKRAAVRGTKQILKESLNRQINRTSGLRDGLWNRL